MLQELKALRKQLRRGRAAQAQDEVVVPKAEPDDDDLTEEEVDVPLDQDVGIGQEFDVEEVLGKKFDENDNQFYLIRWKNWNGEPTWEPVENTECHQLIEAFEKRFDEKIKSKNSFESREESVPVTNGLTPRQRRYSKPTSARRTPMKQEPARARLSRNAKSRI